MLPRELKLQVLAKLRNAAKELRDALNLSIPVARYDPVPIPLPARNELVSMLEDLNRTVADLESAQ